MYCPGNRRFSVKIFPSLSASSFGLLSPNGLDSQDQMIVDVLSFVATLLGVFKWSEYILYVFVGVMMATGVLFKYRYSFSGVPSWLYSPMSLYPS